MWGLADTALVAGTALVVIAACALSVQTGHWHLVLG
jgi:hypothetical protein